LQTNGFPRLTPTVLMTLALWTLAFVLLTGRSLMAEGPFWEQMLPRFLTCTMGALLCGVLAFALRPTARLGLATQLSISVVASLVTGVVYSVLAELVFDQFFPMTNSSPLIYAVVSRAQLNLWLFLTWSTAYLALVWAERSRHNELRLVQAQALAADAQNRMLRYQINPHFLFNTLNALHSLMLDAKIAKAKQVVLSLADFLRYSLVRSPDEQVTLREEVEAQSAYLRIEEARFGRRLKTRLSVDPDVVDCTLPSMILQPLVENAVKYAVAPSAQPITLEIAARLVDGRVEIEVRDDGLGASYEAHGLGVGLENVRRRLDLAYGSEAEFACGPRPEGGYAVRLRIPKAPR